MINDGWDLKDCTRRKWKVLVECFQEENSDRFFLQVSALST